MKSLNYMINPFRVLILIVIMTTTLFSCKKDHTTSHETFIDNRDGKTYKWFEIGSQKWMSENLDYMTDSGSWIYNNDNSLANTYGRLYDWKTAFSACPEKWHLPSKNEYNTLFENLGGNSIAGGKLKEPGTNYWVPSNTTSGNHSLFLARPGGAYWNLNRFEGLGKDAYFWTSDDSESDYPGYYIVLYYNLNSVTPGLEIVKSNGFSVRCIKDSD